jgi:hypothetical protein
MTSPFAVDCNARVVAQALQHHALQLPQLWQQVFLLQVLLPRQRCIHVPHVHPNGSGGAGAWTNISEATAMLTCLT